MTLGRTGRRTALALLCGSMLASTLGLPAEPAGAASSPQVYAAWNGIQEFLVLRVVGDGSASVEYGVVMRCTHPDRPGSRKRAFVGLMPRLRATTGGGRTLYGHIEGSPSAGPITARVDLGAAHDGVFPVRIRLSTLKSQQRCRADSTFRARKAVLPDRAHADGVITLTGAGPV